ncbi:MAG: hypothetical protein GY943_38715 [Chloroflexi bacterium]|nr:hypothetical protein [Chloroflexota bacterium]
MREIPAWILRLSISEMVGVIAYSQLLAFLDTLLIFIPILLLAAILPAAWLRDKFVAMGTAVAFISSAWFVVLHLNNQIIEQRQVAVLVAWAVSYVVVLGVIYVLVRRNAKVESGIINFMQRLSVLSILYLFIDVVSVVIVVVRNV